MKNTQNNSQAEEKNFVGGGKKKSEIRGKWLEVLAQKAIFDLLKKQPRVIV